METSEAESKQEKRWKITEQNIQELLDNYKRRNIQVMGKQNEKTEKNRSDIGSIND